MTATLAFPSCAQAAPLPPGHDGLINARARICFYHFFLSGQRAGPYKKPSKIPGKTGVFASLAMGGFFCHEGMNQRISEGIGPGEWRIIGAMPQFLWAAFKMRWRFMSREARFMASRTVAVRRWSSSVATLGTLCLFSSIGVGGDDVGKGDGHDDDSRFLRTDIEIAQTRGGLASGRFINSFK